MGHSVTLGGERVGSGSKNKVYMRNYERSTHNLSYDWLSTMGCGMLIPFMCELVTRDDKYEINLKAGLRTIPTKGPLFGSFKLQLDVYQCPLRLYQAILHNNPLAIGLKANQVKFPKIRLYDSVTADTTKESKSANNSLIKYLGISGIGTIDNKNNDQGYTISRDLFGAHVLAYYDIFKNYYANKQEENAYTLAINLIDTNKANTFEYLNTTKYVQDTGQITETYNTEVALGYTYFQTPEESPETDTNFVDLHFQLNKDSLGEFISKEDLGRIECGILFDPRQGWIEGTLNSLSDAFNVTHTTRLNYFYNEKTGELTIRIYTIYAENNQNNYFLEFKIESKFSIKEEEIVLKPFELSYIDDMRYKILSFNTLGQSYLLEGDYIESPYCDAIGESTDFYWQKPLAGICVKTYQSDIFNNWLNTELIDGQNGIAEITAISTSSGSITIDQLQFSEKLYNLLNRIAVSGGTYQDYLDAAYTASAKRFEESPVWIGGMSDEVIFEEIVQTAPAGDGILGTLGGRGNLLGNNKGGRITVKIDEPSLLIGIVSLTPRIVYTQGNKWFNTEIDSLQDIHVPALDAIGFQNLMAETMHYGSTIINAEDSTISERPIIGKIPAWLHYMTNYDQAYGDFAATGGDGYMVLNRNYECINGELQDATTYIDPAKFNYAFGYSKREAQNFWVKIKCSIKARRLMSAKQIPTA